MAAVNLVARVSFHHKAVESRQIGTSELGALLFYGAANNPNLVVTLYVV